MAIGHIWQAWECGDTFAHGIMDPVFDKLAWGLGLVVNLFDPLGRLRLQMRVDSSGRASLDFLDERGRVTFSVPDSVRPR